MKNCMESCEGIERIQCLEKVGLSVSRALQVYEVTGIDDVAGEMILELPKFIERYLAITCVDALASYMPQQNIDFSYLYVANMFYVGLFAIILLLDFDIEVYELRRLRKTIFKEKERLEEIEKKRKKTIEYSRRYGVVDLSYQSALEELQALEELHVYKRDFARCKNFKNEKLKSQCFWNISQGVSNRERFLMGDYLNRMHKKDIQKVKNLKKEIDSDQQFIGLMNKNNDDRCGYINYDLEERVRLIEGDFETWKSLEGDALKDSLHLSLWLAYHDEKDNSPKINDLYNYMSNYVDNYMKNFSKNLQTT